MPKVLIASEAMRGKPGKHTEHLHAAGCEVVYPDPGQILKDEAGVLKTAAGCIGVIAANEPYSDEVLNGLPHLRVVARAGVGYDSVDVAAATKRGIAVTITPQANHQAVAEHAMALMLAVARSIVSNAIGTRDGRWPRRAIYTPLRGKTLGIVGLGRIGHSIATRAAAFGMRLIACEPKPDSAFANQNGIELVDLDTLLSQADFVTLHAPLTDQTRHLINAKTLARMKRGSFLINTARGGLVNEDDLLEALQSGHIAGAGLDVFAVEPVAPNHPLLALDNVVGTAHVASFDTQAIEDMISGAARCVAEIVQGRWPEECVVNPEVKANLRR